jgi:hypothetical protein
VDHSLLHCDVAYDLGSIAFGWDSMGVPKKVADVLFRWLTRGWWNLFGKHSSSKQEDPFLCLRF